MPAFLGAKAHVWSRADRKCGMNIETAAARDRDLTVVQSLFELYIHDISEFGRWDVNAEGRFDVPGGVAGYWNVPVAEGSRWHADWHGFPFLVHVDATLAGFALVKRIAINPDTFDMGEFFVLRKFRRRGLGRQVACALFDRNPGRWEVREMLPNTPAQDFWRRIIAEYTRGDFTESRQWFEIYGAEFVVQRFKSMDWPTGRNPPHQAPDAPTTRSA
jgi:predicted acetyltransferase